MEECGATDDIDEGVMRKNMVYETGHSHSQLGLSSGGSDYRNRILSAGNVHSSGDGQLTDDSQHTRVTSN